MKYTAVLRSGSSTRIFLKAELSEAFVPSFFIALIVVGVYALLWLVSRWHNVALPTRRLLQAQLDGVRTRLYSEDGQRISSDTVTVIGSRGEQTRLTEANFSLTDVLSRDLDKIRDSLVKRRFRGFLLWSRGEEIAGWRLVHDVERQLVEVYSLERVKTYLAVAEADLRKIGGDDAVALADAIQGLNLFPQADVPPDALSTQINIQLQAIFLEVLRAESPPAVGTQEPAVEGASTVEEISTLNSLRVLLQEALRIIYDYYDTEYIKLVTWHNKAAWLMGVSLTAILLILIFHTGSAWLLGIGAVGGLISRLTRSLKERKAIPTDYGAYWTSFYLSPVFGALAAWVGILLIVGLVELNLLSGPFERVQWGNFSYQSGIFDYITNPDPTSPASLADEGQPLTVNLQAQLSFSSNTQTTATQAIEQVDSETEDDEDPNKNALLTLALALLFGFSERRLTQLTEKLDGAFEPKKEAADT